MLVEGLRKYCCIGVVQSGDAMPVKELSIKLNMAWTSIGSIVNLGSQWLITILVVRLSSGYDAAGAYSLAMAVYGIFAPIAQYNMNIYQVSDIERENTLGEYLAFRLITDAIALILCSGYALITCSHASFFVIILYGLFRSAAFAIEVMHACDQRNRRMDYIGKSLIIQGLSSLVAFVLVFGLSRSLELSLVAMTLVIVAIFFVYDRPKTVQIEAIDFGISKEKARRLLIKCLPLVLAAMAAAAAPSLPRQYLANVFGEASLGIYASVAAPVALVQTGASYIYGPLLGYFSEAYSIKDQPQFRSLFLKTTLGMLAVCVCASLLIALFGESILVLMFGASIAGYTYLLFPLLVLALLTGYMWFMDALLVATRNFRGATVGNATSLAASIALLPLVPHFGMVGVALVSLAACAIAISVMSFLYVAQSRNHWKKQ